MPNSDSWYPQRSQTARTSDAVQAMVPGTAKGRIRQAAPVQRREEREGDEMPVIWVDPEPPADGDYQLWFDTDEPVT